MPFFSQTFKLKAVFLTAALLGTFACAPTSLRAQRPTASRFSSFASNDSIADVFPDAPVPVSASQEGIPPQAAATGPQQTDPQQTKRILGVMPNFRSVSADTKLPPPQSAKDKFIAAGKDTFDYSSFLLAGLQAGFA